MSDDENEAVYVYWMGPGGSDPLCLAHEAEAARLGVEFRNYGWVSGDDFICSKTDKGISWNRMGRAKPTMANTTSKNTKRIAWSKR